jgi:hypothetical protein
MRWPLEMRFIFPLIFGLAISSWGQTHDIDCNCPINKFTSTKAETIFPLANGKRIALCGYIENRGKEKLFSEFVLAVCGEDKVIDFWDALTVCRITTHNDTLRIEELKTFPTGDNFKLIPTVWRIEKIYVKNGYVARDNKLNKNINKYRAQEINNVLEEYEKATGKPDEDKMILASRLFIASLSGDKTSRKYLVDFKTKFGTLDGAFAEEYEELIAMLRSWEHGD